MDTRQALRNSAQAVAAAESNHDAISKTHIDGVSPRKMWEATDRSWDAVKAARVAHRTLLDVVAKVTIDDLTKDQLDNLFA